MKNTWYVNPSYSKTIQITFQNLNSVFAIQTSIISQDPICTLLKTTIDGKTFYIKRYSSSGTKLRKYIGRSRCRAEWENLLFFQSIGLHTPTLAAYGEQRSLCPSQRKAVLITEEINNAADLFHIANTQHILFNDKTWRKKIICQAAHILRTLHQKKFIHFDFKWRNLIISLDKENPIVYLIDVPMGKKRYGLMLHHGKKRDLNMFDKYAKRFLSKTDRLRFYLAYSIFNSML